MKIFKVIILVICLGVVGLAGCGGGGLSDGMGNTNLGGSSGSSDQEEYSGNGLEGGTVAPIAFSNSRAIIDFGQLNESDEYIVQLHTYNASGQSEICELGRAADLDIASLIIGRSNLLSFDPPDQTEDFHERLRKLEADLPPPSDLVDDSPSALRVVRDPSVGDVRAFMVLNSFARGGDFTSIRAILRYKTDNFLFYVDAANGNSFSDNDLRNLLEPFDEIVDEERNLFGEEADVDGDGRFNILATKEVNELGRQAGGIVSGFFYAVDQFPVSGFEQSNHTEIFYTFVPDPSGRYGYPVGKGFALSNILPSVLVHEYQHLINFNQHYFVNKGAPETPAINEGMSHLAEDIYSIDYTGYMTRRGIENPARVAGYLAAMDRLCIVCGASLYQRGGSYLFLRYIYEQAEKGNFTAVGSGAALIRRLIDTNLIGVGNIATAVYGTGAGDEDFRELMGQFGLAVFLSDTGLTTDSRFQFDGINLRDPQNDNRGTILKGPSINVMDTFPASETIGSASVSYIKLTGNQINDLGGSFAIKVGENENAGGFVIQTGL